MTDANVVLGPPRPGQFPRRRDDARRRWRRAASIGELAVKLGLAERRGGRGRRSRSSTPTWPTRSARAPCRRARSARLRAGRVRRRRAAARRGGGRHAGHPRSRSCRAYPGITSAVGPADHRSANTTPIRTAFQVGERDRPRPAQRRLRRDAARSWRGSSRPTASPSATSTFDAPRRSALCRPGLRAARAVSRRRARRRRRSPRRSSSSVESTAANTATSSPTARSRSSTSASPASAAMPKIATAAARRRQVSAKALVKTGTCAFRVDGEARARSTTPFYRRGAAAARHSRRRARPSSCRLDFDHGRAAELRRVDGRRERQSDPATSGEDRR